MVKKFIKFLIFLKNNPLNYLSNSKGINNNLLSNFDFFDGIKFFKCKFLAI
jgi:hypothetical protein